jgi:hypothetical protein
VPAFLIVIAPSWLRFGVTCVVTAVSACGSSDRPSSSTAVARTTTAGDCVSPLYYGAIAGDGRDDRAALQATFDAACASGRPVCLPAGDLHVSRRYGTGAGNAWSLAITCDGVEVVGQGDASRLVMLGSAKVGAMTGPGDWWLIKLSGSRHRLHDFAIEGGSRTQPTSEQTHLIKIAGPASDIRLDNLSLSLPPAGPSTGGDCIQAGGEERTPVSGLVIERVRAVNCDRSFVGLQRWVSKVTIASCTSEIVGDQVLDEEPTGVGTIGDVTVRDSTFRRNGLGDAAAVAITGGAGGAAPGYDHLIESTTIDGAVVIFDSAKVTMRDVRVVSSGNAPTIAIKKRSTEVFLDRVYAEHTGTVAAPVVYLGVHGPTWPTNAMITRSHLVQRGPGDVVRAEPVVGLTVDGNRIECLGPVAGTFAAVAVRSIKASVDDILVTNNEVTGNCAYLLRASATPSYGVGATRVTANRFRGGTTGVFFENSPPSKRPIVDGNTFDAVSPAAHVVGAGSVGFDGKN